MISRYHIILKLFSIHLQNYSNSPTQIKIISILEGLPYLSTFKVRLAEVVIVFSEICLYFSLEFTSISVCWPQIKYSTWGGHFALKPLLDFRANAPRTCCRAAPNVEAFDLVLLLLLLEDLADRSSAGASPPQKYYQRKALQTPRRANIRPTSSGHGATMSPKSG